MQLQDFERNKLGFCKKGTVMMQLKDIERNKPEDATLGF